MHLSRVIVCAVWLWAGDGRLIAAEVSKEYQVKAVLLWRLAQFIGWPEEAFASPESPIVIGILGENPFGRAVEIAVREETAHGRKLEVRYLQKVEQASSCHILFISSSERARARKITSGLAGKSVLTVSDMEGFAVAEGGMVRFVFQEGKVKLRMDVQAASAAGLSIDARLLRTVDIVR